MATLLLLLTTAQAAAIEPGLGAPPPARPSLCDRLANCYDRIAWWHQRFALVTSGAACSYNTRGIPVSNAPTPAYSAYIQRVLCPEVAAPASPAPADGAEKPKAKEGEPER
jgi:hypothetical protein